MGVMAGAAVGVSLGVLLLVLIVWLVFRKKDKKKYEEEETPNEIRYAPVALDFQQQHILKWLSVNDDNFPFYFKLVDIQLLSCYHITSPINSPKTLRVSYKD